MANLIYTAITSLDGSIEDEDGNFQWATPDDEVFAFINDLERPVGTYLYGRRMYETMVYWETASSLPDQSPVEQDFTRIWLAAEKIVYSRSLEEVTSAKTRLERNFDAGEVRQMAATSGQDISVAGADLAAQAFKAGIVDEVHLLVTPVIVGGGKPAIPTDCYLYLELLDMLRFDSGVVHLHYRTKR
jgi:dihydrofolate reductase